MRQACAVFGRRAEAWLIATHMQDNCISSRQAAEELVPQHCSGRYMSSFMSYLSRKKPMPRWLVHFDASRPHFKPVANQNITSTTYPDNCHHNLYSSVKARTSCVALGCDSDCAYS